jgi:hypothetical protein
MSNVLDYMISVYIYIHMHLSIDIYVYMHLLYIYIYVCIIYTCIIYMYILLSIAYQFHGCQDKNRSAASVVINLFHSSWLGIMDVHPQIVSAIDHY